MDVPVSIGVLLAAGVSIAELLRSGPHAYFDAAVTLLFFLLVGRYLDLRARGFARRAAQRLVAFTVRPVSVMTAEGIRQRSEEHRSELQSLMRNSYAVFCLKKKKKEN